MIEESEFLVSSRRIWSRKWHAALVFLPGKFDGQRSLAGLWGSQSWTQLNTHTHTHNRRIQYAELLKEVLVQEPLSGLACHRILFGESY